MAKNFKNNDPNSNLLPPKKNNVDSNNEPESIEVDTTPKPEPPKPTKTNEPKEKKKPEYLRLDVTDYKDYISLMAEHTTNTTGKYVSMTQYILRLIEADKQKNIETYEKLEQIERMKRELM